ncbi:MAG: hypothetical protein NZL93_02935, partial [Chthoniobacterales bacterium]|nr:hypothetical protein [Chthoniobacterales bacterium]
PKLNWALRNPQFFPADINRIPRELLLRIPGIGVKNANRILLARKHHSLSIADLSRLKINLRKALPFITTNDYRPNSFNPEKIRDSLSAKPKQMEFSFDPTPPQTQSEFTSIVTGEF